MIPLFILVTQIGIYNTRWAMVLPAAVGAWFIIITRTFISATIPDSLRESAKIDGANDIVIFLRIILPLCTPILAVLILFNAVSQWNTFFHALIFLPSARLHPLQIFLRRILIGASEELADDVAFGIERNAIVIQLRYAAIMVTILPIICVYPFLQKYFTKGIMGLCVRY
jgi:putative aldouronate transport system permease protein